MVTLTEKIMGKVKNLKFIKIAKLVRFQKNLHKLVVGFSLTTTFNEAVGLDSEGGRIL